jgi:hypothetical protein
VDQKAKILSTINDMTSAFHKGDIDGIMRTYEPTADPVQLRSELLAGWNR